MVKVLNNFPLSSRNSFTLSVCAKQYAEFSTEDQLCEIIEYCIANGLPWFVLGGGSNVIFDGDFPGMVIASVGRGIGYDNGLLICDAGVEWDAAVAWSVDRGLVGLENLSYIPGTVGAAPVQNIGAYGREAKDFIEWVDYFDTQTLKTQRLTNAECAFGYRESVFKHELKGCAIVTQVAFRLSDHGEFNIEYGDVKQRVAQLGGPTLKNIRQAIIEIRQSKLPDPTELGNAGSFFKNPVVSAEALEVVRANHPDVRWFDLENGEKKIPAGWLIEKAGWKGRRIGNVGVHERQALVIVNYGGATAADILGLSTMIQADVFAKFGIQIEREVNVVK